MCLRMHLEQNISLSFLQKNLTFLVVCTAQYDSCSWIGSSEEAGALEPATYAGAYWFYWESMGRPVST